MTLSRYTAKPSHLAAAGVRAFVHTINSHQRPEKAAAHAFFLAESQPFVDGNKRTAALALTVFLDLNDHELHEATDTELADILIDLGSGTIEQGEFFGWVCNHARSK